jgi:hypothetical protein
LSGLAKGSPRPSLPEVTLVAVTSVALEATVAAILKSIQEVDFGNVLLLSDSPPPTGTDPSIRWERIEHLGSRADYSRFMLRELAARIETTHALCIQWDGYVLQGEAWDPRFLDYDYIGAVWPQFSDGFNVGNGGFSLRSKRLLEECTRLSFDGSEVEDLIISRRCRPDLERRGIRFAPSSTALRFSYERTPPTGREFGFHGAFNLVRYLSPDGAFRLFRKLEPGMLARSERTELLRWALARGRMKFALAMLARLI